MAVIDSDAWRKFLINFPDVHILQTGDWGEFKNQFGWKPVRVVIDDVGAQILFKKLPLGLSIAYIPKGPVGNRWERIIPEIEKICKKERAIFLKIEPDNADDGSLESCLPSKNADQNILKGYYQSTLSIQPPRTILVDLKGSEDEILNRMKQKTRYNIRLAMKKEIKIHRSDDVSIFHQLMKETGDRDNFGIHQFDYFNRVFQIFSASLNSVLLLAYFHQAPLAGIMVFKQGRRAYYLYGASSELHRELMPAYLLQWEAMVWAKNNGCDIYDLWGVPDEEEDVLENSFLERTDGLWKVYRFKRGFGGNIVRSSGPWDRIFLKPFYRSYRLWEKWRGGIV